MRHRQSSNFSRLIRISFGRGHSSFVICSSLRKCSSSSKQTEDLNIWPIDRIFLPFAYQDSGAFLVPAPWTATALSFHLLRYALLNQVPKLLFHSSSCFVTLETDSRHAIYFTLASSCCETATRCSGDSRFSKDCEYTTAAVCGRTRFEEYAEENEPMDQDSWEKMTWCLVFCDFTVDVLRLVLFRAEARQANVLFVSFWQDCISLADFCSKRQRFR